MINYQISAKESMQVQGISVNLSAEFNKDELPKSVSANCNGSMSNGTYMSVSANYNLENNNFQTINGSNIPDGFVENLREKIIEFYNQIKEGGME